ncbi:MAG: hypothetical protein ACTHN5_20890 [Phycisphaerae bacterium]
MKHHGVCTNASIMANTDGTEDAGSAADVNAIFNYWNSVILTGSRYAKGGVVANLNIVTDRLRMKYHTAMVPNSDATPQFYRVWQTDSANTFHGFEHYQVNQCTRGTEQLEAKAHTPVAKPVKCDGPEALLEGIPIMCSEIFSDQSPKGQFRGIAIGCAPGRLRRLC